MLVCRYVGVCKEVWLSHTSNAEPISAARASVEAPISVIHRPLPASKTVLSSWSMVEKCPRIAPHATGITGSYYNRLVIPEVPLYKFENIEYLQRTRAANFKPRGTAFLELNYAGEACGKIRKPTR